ncbi:hypothetical protein M666_09020 [Cellulophaga baltica 18]|uniref:Ribosomal small subunit protein bTHX n=2 Tax=Cellulophaga baltica TaxID=76594 RepID=A0A1G7KN31_9FLAO|nr:hypothetical protein M666_09020 [Cellulophaga baltica 18]SDF38632.1 ribosomal small subunit protein bTHX [Cellulophaga baltica]
MKQILNNYLQNSTKEKRTLHFYSTIESCNFKKKKNMGKGDKKSRKGKIANNSFGARRPKKIKRRPTVEEKIAIKKKK